MLKLYDGKAHDFDKEPSDIIQNAYDAKVEFDKGYMLTFKVLIDDKGLHKKIKNEMIVVCKGGYKNRENAFRIKERLEFGTYVEFKCPHLFYDLDNKRTKVPSGLFTANDIISFIQSNTEDLGNFKFKNDYIFGNNMFEFGNYKELRDKKPDETVEPKVEYYNTLELMNKVFSECDCDYMFDFWTINVYNKLGEDKESLIYEYKNIEDWEGIHSMEKKATRVIAQSDYEHTTTYKIKFPNQKLYIHFAYGNDNKGKDFTNTNYQNRTYIGYYVDTKYLNSPDAKDYKWVSMKIPKKTKKKPAFTGDRKVKGITTFMVGSDYRDGIPIKLDKKTFYLHTAFANYLDGKDININDGTGAKYVGFMIDDKKDNTRVKEWFTFNHLTEKGGLLINDRRTLKEKVHLETVVESPLINNYAQVYTDTYVNNEVKTVEELTNKVKFLFQDGWDKPKRTIKCKVKLTNNDNRHRLTTLSDYIYYADNDPCDLYDTVILRYITHDVDERIKCVGFEYDPINESLETLTFGTKDKNDTISASVSGGVKAEIDRTQTEFEKRWEEINDYYDEELRKGREEFNHIWLSEKIDFINGFNEYGEYVEDIQEELERIEEERKQKEEEFTKRLEENDKNLQEVQRKAIEEANTVLAKTTESLDRMDKKILTIGNDVTDLKSVREELNAFREDTKSQFSQTVSLEKYNRFNQLYQYDKSTLTQTVNELRSTLTSSQSEYRKNYNQLTQRVDGLTSEVGSINSLGKRVSVLEQIADGFSTNVAEIKNNSYKLSRLSQKADEITSTVSSLSKKVDSKPSLYDVQSIISQKVDNITIGIGKVTGLNDKLNSLSSSISLTRNSITQKADKIDLVGKVSFSDLNDKGYNRGYSTFIDGGKIMTDTIQAKQIKSGAILSSHLYVDSAMIKKLNTNHLLANELRADNVFANYVKALDIDANRIKSGIISAKNGVSKINLNDGTFSFYNGSLSIDEKYWDSNSSTYRARLHTQSTFRVSYGTNPIVELNSGGITLFKEGEKQSSSGTNKIRSNSYGNVQIATITSGNNTRVHVEIGSSVDIGFVMRTYGSLRVGGNLQVDKSIKYGGSISQGKYY